MSDEKGPRTGAGTRSTDDYFVSNLQELYDKLQAAGAKPKFLGTDGLSAECQHCKDGCRLSVDSTGRTTCPHGCSITLRMLGGVMLKTPGPTITDTRTIAEEILNAVGYEEDVRWSERLVDGGTFVLDAPDTPPAVWGDGNDILWAQGEALMICGPAAVGKTTIAVQLVAARCGIGKGALLGLPIQAGKGKVLYLAMDRPPQIARAMARLFGTDDRDALNDKLVVWKGPPPHDLAKRPGILANICQEVGADTVIVDSLKDAVLKLSEDESGSGYNRARQQALVAGVEVIELHHQRKASGDNKRPDKLADVYGSTWLTAGAGSVLMLWGEAGDPVVQFTHLKQPLQELGPWQIIHDHEAGTSELHHPTDVLSMIRVNRDGLTARLLAIHMFNTEKPTEAQLQKARRKLQGYVDKGLVVVRPGHGQDSSTYHLMELRAIDGDDGV